jgi:hypothetical protein
VRRPPAASPLVALLSLVLTTALSAVPAQAVPARPLTAQAVQGAGAVPPSGVVVSPDPARDLYVGTGGLVVPASRWRGSASGRSDAASCLDCHWRVSVLCTKAESAAGTCRGIDVGCPVGTVPVRIWLLRPGRDWEVVGRACQGATPPVTTTDLGSHVRDRAETVLPPLRAGVQPTGGALVRLPALFRSGQPAQGISGADLSVLGLDVRLTARVRWHWTYGDGAEAWTSSPGGVWPVTTVNHAYHRAGTVRASVQAVWRGEFTVEGLGPFAVPGPALVQDASVVVVVRPAHAHLVG